MKNNLLNARCLATLGPSSSDINKIESLLNIGINIFRINFSHSDQNWHKQTVKTIREISDKLNKPAFILADLQGPKLRISSFKNGFINLDKGDKFILDLDCDKGLGDKERVGILYQPLINDTKVGDTLLLDDGRIQLRIIEIKDRKIFTEVLNSGKLLDFKGINKLGGGLSAKSLTSKDVLDLKFAIEIGVDMIGVSFIKTPEDVEEARALSKSNGRVVPLVSKIECAELFNNEELLKMVIKASDAVMIARGDLAIEIGDENLSIAQKNITRLSKLYGKPVIAATQLMESMIESNVATRAEVCDVANALFDGVDSVMLSAETASGKYPLLTSAKVLSIINNVENYIKKENNNKYVIKSISKNSNLNSISISAIISALVDETVSAVVAIDNHFIQCGYVCKYIMGKKPILIGSTSSFISSKFYMYKGTHIINLSKELTINQSIKTIVNSVIKYGIIDCCGSILYLSNNKIELIDVKDLIAE